MAATPPTPLVLITSLANQGTVAAENVEVALGTPPGVTFLGNTGACTTPFPCSLGTMPPDSASDQRVITSSFDLPRDYAGPDALTFSATATTTTAEANIPSNQDSWKVTVIHPRPLLFHLLEPCRLLDTRSSTAIAANTLRTVPAVGSCGVPASARALALNVTVVQPTTNGDLRVSAEFSSPFASTINFGPGQVRANNAVIGLGPAGALWIQADMTAGSVHVILDVSGYLE
jgi:hypothetical protein